MSALLRELEDGARALGFARLGVAEAAPPARDVEAFEAWLARGDHASMGWMERTRDVRIDPAHPGMLEGARSVVVVAMPYGAAETLDLGPGRIARYARGRDYHRVIDKRLRQLADVLVRAGYRARSAIDTKPLLERAYAALAGIGFVGKNACVIVPGLGSHVFLGSIVTDAELPLSTPIREGCGECRRCLDGCPTDAFRGPRILDARRCVSYLTIEHEGPIDPELEARTGDWLFGCDACQDVCPYNAGRALAALPDPAFERGARFESLDPASLAAMDEPTFLRFAEGSPLRRAGRASLARNLAIVLGNAGARIHLPILESLADDPDEVVRDTAARARERLTRRGDYSDSSSSASSSSDSDSSPNSSSS